MKSKIIIGLLLLSSISARAETKENYHCPLTSEYLLEQLDRIENLSNSPALAEIVPLEKHSVRMASEVLANDLFKNNDKCSYFFVSVNLKGMDSTQREIREYNYNDLRKHVKSCKLWVSEKFSKSNKKLRSIFCK